MREEDSSRGLKSSVSQEAAAMFTITGRAQGSSPQRSAYMTCGERKWIMATGCVSMGHFATDPGMAGFLSTLSPYTEPGCMT